MITKLIIHCSATSPDQDIGADEIRDWHVNKNGWADIGYHYVICRDGMLELGRPENKAGAHAKGYNSESIGICLVGGVDKNGTAESVDIDTNGQVTLSDAIPGNNRVGLNGIRFMAAQ